MLRVYPSGLTSLNAPCTPPDRAHAEMALGFALPAPLQTLLDLNNGQQPNSEGLFKSVSGWDVYRRHVFLDALGIARAYQTFVADAVLLDEFGRDEIPFALCKHLTAYDEVFTIHRHTLAVSLIWTEYIDPYNPPEWQVRKFARAETLCDFILLQHHLYW